LKVWGKEIQRRVLDKDKTSGMVGRCGWAVWLGFILRIGIRIRREVGHRFLIKWTSSAEIITEIVARLSGFEEG